MPEIGPMSYAEIGPMSVPRWPRSGRYWANIVWLSGLYHYMKALWNWQRNSKFNRASRAGKQRHRENCPADNPLLVQEESDVPTIHSLMAQNRYVAQ